MLRCVMAIAERILPFGRKLILADGESGLLKGRHVPKSPETFNDHVH